MDIGSSGACTDGGTMSQTELHPQSTLTLPLCLPVLTGLGWNVLQTFHMPSSQCACSPDTRCEGRGLSSVRAPEGARIKGWSLWISEEQGDLPFQSQVSLQRGPCLTPFPMNRWRPGSSPRYRHCCHPKSIFHPQNISLAKAHTTQLFSSKA